MRTSQMKLLMEQQVSLPGNREAVTQGWGAVIRLSCQEMVTMSRAKLRLFGCAILMFSTAATAVGMGGINVTSGLGEKLKADINLVAVTKAEKASLVARLASPDTYKNAGLEYPYNNKFKFDVANHADGEPYLKVSSAQPVNDPFVVVMVELNWASGRLIREYTFLLDPPGYVADQPAPASVQAVAPVAQAVPNVAVIEPAAPAAEVAPVDEVVDEPVAVAEPEPVAVKPEPVKEPTPVKEPAPVAVTPAPTKVIASTGKFDIAPRKATPSASTPATDSYLVKRGDTLAKIASEDAQSNVSLERTLVALYRANANQFDGQNMNRLSVGKTLRLPTEQEIRAVTQSDATTEIRAQAEDWNAYRQQLASAATTSKESQGAKQVATGKINSSVADKAPVAKDTAKEVLKLSKGEAPGDKAAAATGGKAAPVQEQKNAVKEEEIAKAKALKEGQARAIALEKNLKDLEKLAQLKVEAAALAAPKPAPVVDEPPTIAAVAASAVAAAEKMKAEAKPVVEAEPSLMDTVLQEPTYLAAGGAVLAGLLGLGWFAARRKKAPAFTDEMAAPVDIGSITGKMAVPVTPSPDTGDFTHNAVTPPPAVAHVDDVDPISEADLFLNFGRDSQAEDILKDALVNTPSNHKIHLKLLEIYAKRKDSVAFEAIARQLQGLGDEAAFKQASDMGRGIDPRNALYGGSAAIEDASSATMQAPVFATAPKMEEVASPVEVDFDLDAEPTGKFSAAPEHDFLAESQKTMSLPATSASEASPDALNLDQMIFDVTGEHPTMQMDKMFAPPEVAKIEEMEFTLDYPVESAIKSEPEVKAATVDFSSIDLNLDDAPSTNFFEPAQDENWQEVATKLDLAKAYQEMGDGSGAREILEEVLREGDAGQRQAAQDLINQLA